MAAKKIPEAEQRTERFTILLTKDEIENLRDYCFKHNLKLSKVIRRGVDSALVKKRKEDKEEAKALADLD